MAITVRTVIGVMAVSAGAAGAMAAWGIDDLPVPLRLPERWPAGFKPQPGNFEPQPSHEGEPSSPRGFEHAPPPYRRVIEVHASRMQRESSTHGGGHAAA